jgi:predicted nucleic acid-binding protein
MTRYLLDSNILGYLENADSPFHDNCISAFTQRIGEDFCLSILTIYEMDYSIAAASETLAPRLNETKNKALESFTILPLTLTGSEYYGKLKTSFKTSSQSKPKAMKVHTVDIILATTALEHDAVMVSNDRIFSDLRDVEPGLTLENWSM